MAKGNVEVKVKVKLSLWSIFKMFLFKLLTIVEPIKYKRIKYSRIKKPRKDELILFECPGTNQQELQEFKKKLNKAMKKGDPILVPCTNIKIIKGKKRDIYVDTKSNRGSKASKNNSSRN